MIMKKIFSFFYFLILTNIFLALSLQGEEWCECENNTFYGITIETRVAYYRPYSSADYSASKRLKRIYGDGWPEYQVEISKGFKNFGYLFNMYECESGESDLECRIWLGASGFSRKGHSIGFYDETKLQLIPVSLGLKFLYPIFNEVKFFVGGAVCYSFLKIHDHSQYVHEYTFRQKFGGLLQSGITYNFCGYGVFTIFADYFFQRFHFSNTYYQSYYGIRYYYDSRYIERFTLDLSGFKFGLGLGLTF